MKWTFIFELLLIFILIGFAASGTVKDFRGTRRKHDDTKHVRKVPAQKLRQDSTNGASPPQTSTPNRFCNCAIKTCNCCRNFNVPLLNIKGPGCAALQYLDGDRLAISMRFNERVIANHTINGPRPPPICMPLPAGITKFCGRVYNIGRREDEFNACLGLELRSLNDLEASMRVSCFRFNNKGFRLTPPEPLPIIQEDNDDEDDDDDDDDDYDGFDFDGDDDNEIQYGSLTALDDDFVSGYFQETDSGEEAPVRISTTARPVVRRQTTKTVARRPLSSQTDKTKDTVKPKPVNKKRPELKKPTTTTTTEKQVLAESIPSGTQPPKTSSERISGILTSTTDILNASDTTKQSSTTSTTPTTKTDPEISSTISTETPVKNTEASTDHLSNEIMNTIAENPKVTTSTIIEAIAEATTESNVRQTENDEEDEDDDDEDPVAEVVEEVIEGSDETSKEEEEDSEESLESESTETDKEESKEIVDEVVDGISDTFGRKY